MKRIQNHAQIRALLRAYLVAELQHKAILSDREVQAHFKAGADTEANRLIDQRYPFGRMAKVREFALALLREMYRCTPETLTDSQIEAIWFSPKLFAKALDCAERC